MECIEGVKIDIELRVGKDSVLRDGTAVGRKGLVVERFETVVRKLVVVAQRITGGSDSRSRAAVGGAMGQESVDVPEAVVWEYEGREQAVVDAEIVEFSLECVGVWSEEGVDTSSTVGT